MKIKHIIVLLVVLVFVTQPVSAGFFEDIVNKITGKVTEEVAEEAAVEPEPEPVPEEPVPEVPAVEEPVPEEPVYEMPSPPEDVEEASEGSEDTVPVVPAEEEEEVVEEESEPCPPIPISRWCPDCNLENYGTRCLCPMKTDEKGCSVWDCDSCKPISEEECADSLDCPTKMKCENSVCVDVGCIGEGGRAPAVATSPEGIESLQHLATECCAGLKGILKPDEYDENCNLEPIKVGVTGGRTVCSNCGNRNCESWETKCNCPNDCTPKPPEPRRQCRNGETKNHICPDRTEVPECKCENSMWVCKISPENACPEPPKPKTCAAKIEINFDKTGYAAGDPFKFEVGIFDSQGNPIPNYPFYGRMYDDRWHTPDLKRTGADGYFRASGETPQKPLPGVTKGIFNVYTKEIGSCGSVEDTTELKLKKKEPEPCGIGRCIPEPKPPKKIPIEAPKKAEIFYPCSGCELEDKCYPFGYRKGGKYCSDDNKFVGQLEEDSTCDNNFECKSNVCIDGECISGGLLRKIIKWFKKFIGIKPEPPKPPEPKPEVDCSELLIEKNIGDYEYTESAYGPNKESQAPLISDEGEQIGTIKCCVAQYLDENEKRGMAIVCPYNDRQYVENLIKQLPVLNKNFVLGEYKGQKAYQDRDISMVWAHENYAIASGRAYEEEGSVFPEDVADAYLDKYPSDLG